MLPIPGCLQICIHCILVMWKDVCRFWITLHSAAVLCTHLLMYVAAHTLHTVNVLNGKTWSYQRQRRHFCASQRARYSLTPLNFFCICYSKMQSRYNKQNNKKSLSNYGRLDFLENLLSCLIYVKNACALIIGCIFLLLLPLEFLLIVNKKQTKRH